MVAKLWIFKCFRDNAASIKWSFWGGFLGPDSPNIARFCQNIFTRGSIQGHTNSVWRTLEKFKFLQKREIPKVCRFVQTLTPFFPMKMAKTKKSKYFSDKNSAIGLSKYANGKTVSPLPFKWKIGLLFTLFECLLKKIWAWSKIRGSESKSNLACPEV